jgi:superfamily II DNA or RNA helicase
MVQLPTNLKMYQRDAEATLQRGFVKEIEFSGSTYQILVEDLQTQNPCWVFLQLEGKGQIKDGFCSCEETEESLFTPCVHLAAAYLSLFNTTHSLPLHQRFARSLWNQLCQIYANHVGDDPNRLTCLELGYYVYPSHREKILFFIEGKNDEAKKMIEDLLKERPQQTEETSLKFSNLPHEEILLWREGKPSAQLRYELSFWSDLAKWLFRQQERGDSYQISFKYSKSQIPNWITADFAHVTIGFHLSEDDLLQIIPALSTVNSPLVVQNKGSQGISRITYDKKRGILHIEGEKVKSILPHIPPSKNGIAIKEWIFVPDEGFYAEEPHILLQHPDLEGNALAQALTEHGRLIATFLTDYPIHLEPIPVSYKLFFDKQWNLHIVTNVFEPGDLQHGDSRLIGDWVFLDEEGFYPLQGKRFEEVETIIPIYQVADFVTQNRAWLNTQPGFHLYIKGIEYQTSYSVSPTNRLTFSKTLVNIKEEGHLQDFGAWVYLEGYGFYSKSTSVLSSLLKPGLSLSAEQIPLFIKMNRQELALVPGFFSDICPITQVGLRIELGDKRRVKVTPEYETLHGFERSSIRLFDEFVYVEGKGFYELPHDLRLPEKFRYPLELEGKERDHFLTEEIRQIQQFIVFIDPYLKKPENIQLVAHDIAPAQERGRGWYRVKLAYVTESGEISIPALWEDLRKKQLFAFMQVGLIDLRDKKYDWLRHLGKDRIEKESGTLVLTTLEWLRIHAFQPIALLGANATSEELFNELMQLRTSENPNVEGLLSHLRPYQEIGVQWLWFLYHHQLSGILCDDMGLGKTHQAMGLLASIKNLYHSYAEGISSHFLIVCPTSVLYHWQEKLQTFLPTLRICTFYGINRSLDAFYQEYDILLTSYGILRNEIEILSKIHFEIAIFDEIQIAKNQFSQIYAALRQIKCKMRLGLTGTPIENHLRELKSLFDIVLPSYLPGENEYRDFFTRPIEKEHNPQRKALLKRLIKPLILRRKKEDVLEDLPEKIEEIAHCDLSAYQYQLYMEVLQQRRRQLIENLEDSASPVPYLHIFALLSHLKQICDHPAVYLKTPKDYQTFPCGKWDLFLELLREARESEQKVVVFSQFLHMLTIIETYLTEQNIGYALLKGATRNRKEQIQRFNQDPNCEVFVGSLHAAGLGVDLTAGSVVIHYDRWWNAARENQATDRVHRIGQTRGVQVFKLVTVGTFEEKIDAMITNKGKWMEEVIGVDDPHVLKLFNREELIDLLSLAKVGEGLTTIE